MPWTPTEASGKCPICTSPANIYRDGGITVNCARCGDYASSREQLDDYNSIGPTDKNRALASHLIRKMSTRTSQRIALQENFFDLLPKHALPTPPECLNSLLLFIARDLDGSPGSTSAFNYSDPSLLAEIGVLGEKDIVWLTTALRNANLIGGQYGLNSANANLTALGWLRYEELLKAHTSSRFAFLARQFRNADLDEAYEKCLADAVRETGYELRTVTQRAGLIDAVIEDEIRRCRFLIADLSDDNAGAYWEAGFAEGLGKDVIYICKVSDGANEKRTHFDTNHRHTVRWDLASLEETAKQLKAVIRNTLLGDAKQSND